jgi:hypothetical protein
MLDLHPRNLDGGLYVFENTIQQALERLYARKLNTGNFSVPSPS